MTKLKNLEKLVEQDDKEQLWTLLRMYEKVFVNGTTYAKTQFNKLANYFIDKYGQELIEKFLKTEEVKNLIADFTAVAEACVGYEEPADWY